MESLTAQLILETGRAERMEKECLMLRAQLDALKKELDDLRKSSHAMEAQLKKQTDQLNAVSLELNNEKTHRKLESDAFTKQIEALTADLQVHIARC